MIDKSLIRIDIFSPALRSILEYNLTEYLLSTTSNMLALHYAIDKVLQKKEPNAADYADVCAGRIKNFLEDKVLLDETFDTALQTFAIAITPDLPKTEELPSMNKIRDQEKISEIIITLSIGDEISDKDRNLLCDAIDMSLGREDAGGIINLITSQPELIKTLLRSKKHNAETLTTILSQTSQTTSKINSITSDFKQLAGLVACSAIAFTGNIVAIQSFEAIAAAVIIPISVISLKYGSQFGEKIGAKLAIFDNNIKTFKTELAGLVPAFSPTVALDRKIHVQEVKAPIDKINVQDIAKDLAGHIDTISTSVEVAKIQKSLREIRGNSADVRQERGK